MAYAEHVVNALIDLDPEKAKETILDALREAKMHRETAAENLGCNAATLFRWISRLDISSVVRRLDREAKKDGWFHDKKGGRPRGRKTAAVTPG